MRLRALLPQLNNSLRCQGTAAPVGVYKSEWRSRAQPIMAPGLLVVLTLNFIVG